MSIVYLTANVTPTITAGAYAAGDAVGGLLTFMAGNTLKGGVIQSARLIDLAGQAAELDLVLFRATFTATADNAAFDPSDADLLNTIGVVTFTADDYGTFGDNAIATRGGIGLVFQSEDLYGQFVVRGTPTYASTSDLKVQLGILLG